MKMRHPGIAIVCLVFSAFAQESESRYSASDYGPHGDPPEVVRRIDYRSSMEPEALRELKNRPLDEIFWVVARKWRDDYGEANERYAKRSAIAKEILTNHPDLEAYLARNLKRIGELIADSEPDFSNPQTTAAYTWYKDYLGFCRKLPNEMAVRLIGPFVFTRHFPAVDQGDYWEVSPAAFAANHLWWLMKERYRDESVPKDVEGARKWWQENWSRFSKEPAYEIYPERFGGSPKPKVELAPAESPKDAVDSKPVAHKGRGAAVGYTLAAGLAVLLALVVALPVFFRRNR